MAPTKPKDTERAKANSGQTLAADWHVGNAAEDSDEVLEKDEIEARLEKLLFGDDAGFLEGLKSRARDQQLTIKPALAGPEVGVGGDEDLTAVADENVGAHEPWDRGKLTNSPLIALLPRLWRGSFNERTDQRRLHSW